MRILVLTLGTRSDVQPYVALSKSLIQAGHQVTIYTSSTFADFITKQGVQYGYINDEILRLIDTGAGREAVEDSGNLLGWLRTMAALTKQVKPLQARMIADAWEAA